MEGVGLVQSWQEMVEQVAEGEGLEGQGRTMEGGEGEEAAGDDGEVGEEADGLP